MAATKITNCITLALDYVDFRTLQSTGEVKVLTPVMEANYTWAIVGAADTRSAKYTINSNNGLIMADITNIEIRDMVQQITLKKVRELYREY